MAELTAIMSTLEIKDTPPNDARTLRKRSALVKDSNPATSGIVKSKRRCSLQPSKKKQNSGASVSTESYYLNNKINSRLLNRSLETIYEDPVINKNGEVSYMGPVKMRRINFNGYVTKCKLKKRKSKVKKSIGFKGSGSGTTPSIKKGKRLSLDSFLARFHTLMSNKPSGSTTKDLLHRLIGVSQQSTQLKTNNVDSG